MLEVGERIRMLRLEDRISQKALGELMGKTANTVSLWERGKIQPSVDVLLQIDKLFDGRLLDSPDVRPWAVNHGGVK